MQTLGLTRVIKYIKHQRWFELIVIIGVIGVLMILLNWAFSQHGIFGSSTIQMGVINFLGLALAAEFLIVLAWYARDLWDNGYTL